MRWQTSSWLGAALALGCTASGGGGGGGGGQAANALTRSMQFQNQGAASREGEPPPPTEGSSVRLITTSGGDSSSTTVSPGSSGVVTMTVENPNADTDPVVTTLIWMEGADSHVELPVSGAMTSESAPNTVANAFVVDEALCNDLCNIAHQVRCYESAVTESGVVTAANLMEITVQCEEAGNPSRCDGGGAGGGGGGDSSCPGLCAHLASECGSEYVRADCVSHCRDEVVSGDLGDPCRACCASARFSTEKCEDEGLSEVGVEDCDDDEICRAACRGGADDEAGSADQ